jgi:ribosome biogenesis GTPase A
MTKKDLCDLSVTNKWVKYYEDKGYNVALINLNEQNDYKKVINIINELVEKINNKRKEKGLKEKDIKAVVVGIPNVGKSTFINKLAGKKIANVGNNPGVTKKNVWLNTTYKMSVLDTPGVLMPRFDNQSIALNLAAMTAIRTEVLPINEVAYHILTMLNKYYPKILLYRYGLEKLTDDYESDFEKISNKLNIKSSHGIDYNRINNFIINDVKLEHIKNITFDRGI